MCKIGIKNTSIELEAAFQIVSLKLQIHLCNHLESSATTLLPQGFDDVVCVEIPSRQNFNVSVGTSILINQRVLIDKLALHISNL